VTLLWALVPNRNEAHIGPQMWIQLLCKRPALDFEIAVSG